MFNRKPNELKLALEKEITTVHAEMAGYDVNTEAHSECLTRLEKLHALLNTYRSERVNPNVVITTLGSVLGVGIIVGYERAHVFTSKAASFVRQAR